MRSESVRKQTRNTYHTTTATITRRRSLDDGHDGDHDGGYDGGHGGGHGHDHDDGHEDMPGREEEYSCRNKSKVRELVMLCARHRVVQTTWQGQGGGSPCAEDLVASKTLSYQRRCRIEDLRGGDTHRGSSDPLCGGALSYRLQSPQPPAASKHRTRDANMLESACLDQHASISMP
jgi:hypothetical protein